MNVNPHRITIALDKAGLFGKTADAKVGAAEPDLDEWETGVKQPTAEQLAKLADLSGYPVEFFFLPDDAEPKVGRAFICDRSKRKANPVHIYLVDEAREQAREAFQ